MKVIFSRKGIDSAYGKGVSPIFPNGDMLSLPIPAKSIEKGIHNSRISYKGQSIQSYKKQLGVVTESNYSHCNPYINRHMKVEGECWCPSFGTHGAAASHLLNEGVAVGDLFLFFGTFQKVIKDAARQWSYDSDFGSVHVMFGFLFAKDILHLAKQEHKDLAIDQGLIKHPHIQNDYPINNLLFMSNTYDSGSFRFHQDLILSNDSKMKSEWRVPLFFADSQISRNKNPKRFRKNRDHLLWRTVSIGQEFVCQKNDKLSRWAKQLIKKHRI